MTGYGREEFKKDQFEVNVEIKTINHRYLDISFNLPTSLLHIEDKLKSIVQEKIKRGKIAVSIYVSGKETSQKHLQTDWNLAKQYIDHLKQLQATYQWRNID